MTLSIRAMALGTVCVAAIAAGSYGFAHGGGHSVAANPPAVYGLDPATAPEEPLVEAIALTPHNVSVTFSNAPVKQVLDWLRKQDANFVIANSSLSPEMRITLNVKDEPLEVVERTIAEAMGGAWIDRDGVLVFRKSPIHGPTSTSIDGDFNDRGPGSKGFEFKLKDFYNRDQFGPEFEKKMQNQFGPEFQRRLQDQFGPEFQRKMQNDFGPKFQKQMQDQFGPEFQKKMQNDFGPEFQKKIQDQFGPDFQRYIEEEVKKAQEQARSSGDSKNPFSRSFATQDFDGLLDSLTHDQRDLMKRKGYLTPKDLTEKQLRMLGSVSGKFEIKVTTDKGEMTIKSE